MISRCALLAQARCAAVALCALLTPTAARSGPLGPPVGSIQATDRVALNEQIIALPYTISEPGSYVLTSNLTGVAGQPGIIIDASDVTLDLNGFALFGVEGSTHGLTVATAQGMFIERANIAIHNGAIRAWGGDGIRLRVDPGPVAQVAGATISNIRVIDCAGSGIVTGPDSIVVACYVAACAGVGVSLASMSSATGVSSLGNGGVGVALVNGGQLVQDCVISGNVGGGVGDAVDARIDGCTISDNVNFGVRVIFRALVTNNVVTGTSGVGVDSVGVATWGHNRVEGNHVVNSTGVGIDFSASDDNWIYRNTVADTGPGGIVAPTSDAPVSASAPGAGPWDNIVFSVP